MSKHNFKYKGRNLLLASVKKEDLTPENVRKILIDVLPKHNENSRHIKELNEYRLGNQEILRKTKTVRPDINHIVVENYAYSIVDFKTNYVHGNPLSYVHKQINKEIKENDKLDDINELNAYMTQLGKQTLDKNLGQDRYTGGTGYRIVLPKNDQVPFEIHNLDPKHTGIVYSSGFRRQKLFAFTYSDFKDYKKNKWYRRYSVYTHNALYTYKTDHYGNGEYINYTDFNLHFEQQERHALGLIPIVEYELNEDRYGLVELIRTQQDALNHITSSELDDLDQFVQSLLVITNAQLPRDKDGKPVSLKGSSVLEITSKDKLQAEVELLSQQSDHTQLKVLHDRIHRAMMSIAGVPIMSDKNSSGGDTGQARLVGEGWTMADERAKSDEFTFERGEKELLELVLSICHKKGKLKTLTNDSIYIKFNRNRSDNLQTKVQALQGLVSTGIIAPEDAISTSELFIDPIEVYRKGQEYAEEKSRKDFELEVERQKVLQQISNQEVIDINKEEVNKGQE